MDDVNRDLSATDDLSVRGDMDFPASTIVNTVVPALRNFLPAILVGMAVEIHRGLVAPIRCATKLSRSPKSRGFRKIGFHNGRSSSAETAVQKWSGGKEFQRAATHSGIVDRLRPPDHGT